MSDYTSLNATLTKQIRTRMKEKGWSVRELERQAGLNERAVLSILQGQSRHPRIDTVIKISKALDCSVSNLIGEFELGRNDLDLEALVYELVVEFVKWSRFEGNRFPSELSEADCDYIADAIVMAIFDEGSNLPELSNVLDATLDRAARISARRRG